MSKKIDWNKIKVDQMKALDIFADEAKCDPNMKQFLVNLAVKLNKVLKDLNSKSDKK